MSDDYKPRRYQARIRVSSQNSSPRGSDDETPTERMRELLERGLADKLQGRETNVLDLI